MKIKYLTSLVQLTEKKFSTKYDQNYLRKSRVLLGAVIIIISSTLSVVANAASVSASTNVSANGNYSISYSAASVSMGSNTLQEKINSGDWNAIANNVTSGTKSYTGKPQGTYYYRVKTYKCSISGGGGGPGGGGYNCTTSYSNSATVKVLTKPGNVSSINISTTSAAQGKYRISWGTASGTVSKYRLQRETYGAGNWSTLQESSSRSRDDTLSDGQYRYRVYACNNAGCRSSPKTSSAVTVKRTPGTPQHISRLTINADTGTYKITWSAASGTVEWYELFRKTGSGSYAFAHKVTSSRSKQVSPPDGSHTYYVRACNINDCGGKKYGTVFTVLRKPGKPSSIQTSAVNADAGVYKTQWGSASGSVSYYKLERQKENNSWQNVTPISGQSNQETLGNGSYRYQVSACNNRGCSLAQVGSYFTVIHTPAAPGNISLASTSTTGNFSLSWPSSSGAVSYELYEDSPTSDWTKVQDGTGRSFSVTAATNGQYSYKVRACVPQKCGAFSNVASINVNLPNPRAPILAVPEKSLKSEFKIFWNDAVLPYANAYDGIWYSVYEKYNDGSWTPVGDGKDLKTLTLTKDSIGTYSYRVDACVAVGGGPDCHKGAISSSVESILRADPLANVDPVGAAIRTADTVGATSYKSSTNSKGQSNISIPLKLPKGVNGIMPSLSFLYSSGRDDKRAHLKLPKDTMDGGFRLSGFSQIHTCKIKETYMCLDGKPLATVVQNPQAMRFRLRGDSFSAIKPLANGGYQLTQPDGTVLEYGTSDDSYLITKDPMDLDVVTSRIRKIKRKTDVFGNQVVYHYHKNQEIQNSYPTAIDYGEGDNLVSIKMNYMSRSYTELVNDDPTHVVIPGGQEDPFLSYEVQNTPLLKGVEIWRNGIKIREYHLASKETDTTDVYWLDQLQECGFGENGGNESCLEPLKFKWDFRDGPAKGAITSVTSKYGLTTEFDYLTMQEGSTVGQFNERPFGEFNAAGVGHVSDLTAEEEDEGKLKTVVTAIRKSDGLGGLNEKQVSYQGVGLTTEAHDFVGFEAMKIYDVVSNTTRYTQFETAGTAFGLQNQVNARSETYLGTNNSGELLSQVFNRYLYFSMDHGEYHQDGHGEKRMLTYLYLNTAQTVYSYQDGQLISVKQTRKTPELDTNLRLLKSMTTETEWASSSNKTSEGKAGDTWSVSDHLLSGVIRKQKVKKQFTNYTNDEWIIGFNHQTDSDWFEGSSTVPYQSVKETQEAYVHNGAYTHRIDNKTSFSGDADLSLSSSFTYDSLGRLLTTTASGVEVASRTSSIDAFEFGGNPAQTTNALSQTASAKYDLRFDSVKETTDINNLVSTIGFDQFGRISTQTNPDNVTVSTTYESCDGVCSRVNGPSGHGGADALIKITRSSPVTSDVVSYFDVFEREIRSETISFDGKAVYRDRLYNKRGQLAYESLPYFSDSTPSWIHYEYDAYGRLAKVNRPDNSSTQTTYSVVGGLPATTVTQHVTDADKAHTDTHRKQTIQNRTGEVYQVHDAYGSSDQVTTEFAYYPTGLSKWIKVAGNEVASFSFDVAGNRITLVDQNLGTVTSKYNGLGELLWEEDNAGLRADYKYDLLGRQTRETTLDGVQNWVYDTSANGKGLLDYTEFVDNDSRFYHKQDLSYYNDSKLSGTKVDIKVPGYTKSYTSGVSYDSYGRLKTTTYPGGVSATNHFNSRGFLEKVLDENGGQLQKVVSVDAFGNITSEEFGPSISTAKAFEPLTGSLRSLSSTRASNQIQNESYRWLSNGMLEKREDARINVSETFDYDPLGRLTDSYTYQSSASSPSRQLSQSYDIYGNIKTKTTVIGEGDDLTDYVYDTSASISGNGGANAVNSVYLNGVNRTLVYNANGAIRQYLSSDGDNRYLDWTARGKPHRVSRGPSESNFNARDEFAYGIDGARYYRKAQWKDTNGQLKNEHTFYVGAYEEVLTEADNEYSALYKTQLGNAIKIKGVKHDGYTITNNTEYLLRDHLGSVAAIVDQNGDIMRLAYEPFGNRRKDNWLGKFNSDELGTLNNNLRRKVSRGYTGHEHLDRTGLIHMNGRVYDPTLGRFLSPDPIVQAPHFSQSYNRYSYVFNNPMRFVDPSGYKTTIRGSDSGGSVCFCSTTFYGGSRKAIASAAAAVLPPDADYLAPVIADYATTGGFSTTFHFNNESVTTYHRMSNRTKNYGSEIADIREGFGGGISQREGFSNAQKDSIGALIQNMGQSSGLLDSNFEIELYQKWWYGDGSNYELEKITFNEILSVGIIKYKEAKSVPLSDGTQGFSAPIDTYGSPKYNYGIGEATVYLNANMKPVGFIDFYNFDQGNRAFIAERVTRSVGEFGKIYNANDYYIYYGVLGP